MTATATRSKPAAKAPPSHPALLLAPSFRISPEPEADLATYWDDCAEFQRKLERLHADRRTLLDGAREMTVGEIIDRGATLVAERAALHDELVALVWRRYELLTALLPDAQRAVDAAKAALEREIRAEREHLATQGITIDSMPAGLFNVQAAERQLTHKIMQGDAVLAVVGELNQAKAELAAMTGAAAATPTVDGCRIPWETAPAAQALIAQLAGVAGD